MRPTEEQHFAPTRDADELLRQFGCRVTAPRRAVVQALIDEDGPVTASRLADLATDAVPGIHSATVYRTISMLADTGIASHVHAGHGPALVRLSAEARVVAVCTDCAAIVSVPTATVTMLVDEMRRASGFELEPGHFALEGRCADCFAAGGSGAEQN